MNMKGNYLDSFILSVIRRFDTELEKETPLGYWIRVNGRDIDLADREINRHLAMRIPAAFQKMSGSEAGLGYIIRDHPETIFSSSCGTVSFTFDTAAAGADAVPEIMNTLMDGIRTDFPHYIIYESGRQKAGGTAVDWFEFRSFALDREVYNIMFLVPLQEPEKAQEPGLGQELRSSKESRLGQESAIGTAGKAVSEPKTVIGTFKCVWQESGIWKPLVLKMLETIQPVT